MPRILVVDDNDAMLKAMVAMLERHRYEVTGVLDGKSALKILEKETPDLLITDLIMPEVEGVELIQQARRSKPNLPILTVSGGGRIDSSLYLKIAERFGSSAVLAKPFSAARLIETVHGLIGAPAESQPPPG